jgi:DNA polymerase V
LQSRNPSIASIVLPPDMEVEIFVVVGVARRMRREHGRQSLT